MGKPVGFDQKVLLDHLDYTALQTKKYTRKEMYSILDGYLRDDITGAKSRKNAITMLMKIWYLVDENLLSIRNEILKQFNQLTNEERLCVHWGLTIAAYPFFRDVANEFGRLFQLQDEVSSTAIGKRMKAAYGERRRVEVATSAVLTSMRAWKVIHPVGGRSYIKHEKIAIVNPLIQSFLIHVLFNVLDSDSLPINLLQSHQLLFPFAYELNISELRESKEFSFYRQGVKELVIERNS